MPVIDLKFARVDVRANGFAFNGVKGGAVSRGGSKEEVSPVRDCFFSITPQRLMEFFAGAMLFERFNRPEDKGQTEDEDNVKQAEGEAQLENKEGAEGGGETDSRPRTARRKGYRMVLVGRKIKGEKEENAADQGPELRYFCRITSTARQGFVGLSAAGLRGRVVLKRTFGIIAPAAALSIITAAYEQIWNELVRGYKSGSYIPFTYPLGVASLLLEMEKRYGDELFGRVLLLSGGERSELSPFRRKELFYHLTCWLLDAKYTFRFRSGAVRISTNGRGGLSLVFAGRRNEELSPLDIIVLWAACSR